MEKGQEVRVELDHQGAPWLVLGGLAHVQVSHISAVLVVPTPGSGGATSRCRLILNGVGSIDTLDERREGAESVRQEILACLGLGVER
jgi:hypothetical protein